MAAALLAVHQVDGEALSSVPAYRRYCDPEDLTWPAWLPHSAVWATAFRLVQEAPPDSPVCFIHRDFHPGNTLWVRGRLSGVVDWTQASFGPPGVDLGHMRWNLTLRYGLAAADDFLAAYAALAQSAVEHQAYWDVVTVIDRVADPTVRPLTRRDLLVLEQHVAAALRPLHAR
jgi:aminoglycoside phosphotransferase (APT) family kinase protein